jgi:hypothetical protein
MIARLKPLTYLLILHPPDYRFEEIEPTNHIQSPERQLDRMLRGYYQIRRSSRRPAMLTVFKMQVVDCDHLAH